MFSFNAKIRVEDYEREFLYDNVVVVKLKINSINVKIYDNQVVEGRINHRIEMQTSRFYRYVSTELYKQAVAGYKYDIANGYPFNHYEAILDYNVTYNENCFLSVYRDTYEYTGGAHGSTVRASDTWHLHQGRLIPMSYYFSRDTNYYERLIAIMIEQAEVNLSENPGIYFDDFRALIIKHFNPESYYLTLEGMAVYYQQYDIAPYSSGIVVFTIPYEQLDRSPSCRF